MRSFSNNSGFSLIQISALVTAMGVFLALLLPFLEPLVLAQKYEQHASANQRIEKITEALSAHVERYGFLPCPASTLDVPDTTTYGRSADCTDPAAPGLVQTNTGRDGRLVRIGVVPGRTLNLQDEYMRDSYGQSFVYAVTELLTSPATYNNDEGGIYVQDAADVDVTETPGGALFTVISLGESGSDGCDAGKSEGENCDNDATFREDQLNLNPFSSAYYDDVIAYSEVEPKSPYGLCGVKGKVFAPGHPDGDENECIDITGYFFYQDMRLTDAKDVTCGASSAFCDGAWFDLMSLTPGSYIVNWDSYLTYYYPQPSQYALIEFEVDGVTQPSQKIPFDANVCDPAGQLQHETGMVNFEVPATGQLRARLRFYGGDNDPTGNGCPGQTPQLNLVVEGDGDLPAQKSFTATAFRRFGGGGAGASSGTPVGSGSGDIIAVAKDLLGSAFATHDDATSEALYNSFGLVGGDKISTAADAGVTIEFIDGAKFVLAENSEFEIDNYEYDTATGDGEAKYSILTGVFMFISGLIPKPKTEIITPTGSIGIRGTKLLIGHSGSKSQVTLLEGKITTECSIKGSSIVEAEVPFSTVNMYTSCPSNGVVTDVLSMCDGPLELVSSPESKSYMLEAIRGNINLTGNYIIVLGMPPITLPTYHCLLQP